jgi:hypothetical protein
MAFSHTKYIINTSFSNSFHTHIHRFGTMKLEKTLLSQTFRFAYSSLQAALVAPPRQPNPTLLKDRMFVRVGLWG